MLNSLSNVAYLCAVRSREHTIARTRRRLSGQISAIFALLLSNLLTRSTQRHTREALKLNLRNHEDSNWERASEARPKEAMKLNLKRLDPQRQSGIRPQAPTPLFHLYKKATSLPCINSGIPAVGPSRSRVLAHMQNHWLAHVKLNHHLNYPSTLTLTPTKHHALLKDVDS